MPLTRRRGERPIFTEDCGGAAAPDGDGSKERWTCDLNSLINFSGY